MCKAVSESGPVAACIYLRDQEVRSKYVGRGNPVRGVVEEGEGFRQDTNGSRRR